MLLGKFVFTNRDLFKFFPQQKNDILNNFCGQTYAGYLVYTHKVWITTSGRHPNFQDSKREHSPRLGLLNLSGLEPPPSGDWAWSLPAGVSLDEASESAPSRSTLHWSSYIRSDGMVNCFLSIIIQIIVIIIILLHHEIHKLLEANTHTHLFSLLPLPVSLKPLAKGLLSIFNCVIWKKLNNTTNGHFISIHFFPGQYVNEGRVSV